MAVAGIAHPHHNPQHTQTLKCMKRVCWISHAHQTMASISLLSHRPHAACVSIILFSELWNLPLQWLPRIGEILPHFTHKQAFMSSLAFKTVSIPCCQVHTQYLLYSFPMSVFRQKHCPSDMYFCPQPLAQCLVCGKCSINSLFI